MNHHIQRVAHRGGSQLAPENTLAAFRNALSFPIDAIELDVHMSRDGHLIVFPDYTIDKRTNGKGNLLDLAKGHVQVYIEMKLSKRDGVYGRYPNMAEAVINEVRAVGMLDQVLIISFDWLMLPLVKSLEPGLPTGVLVSDEVWDPHASHALDTLTEQVSALGCQWINMHRDLFTQDMPAVFHQHGFKLGVWTVNSAAELRRFAAAGVDSLTSDRPDLLASIDV